MLRRDALPGGFRGVARLPDQATTFVQALQRVGMRKGFGIAAKNDIDVIEFAIDLDWFGSNHQVIIGRRALFLRAILRIGHDPQLLNFLPHGVVLGIPLGDQAAKLAYYRAQILARRDHAQPPIEWNRTAMALSGSSDGVSFEITA